jgi:hypothetical protein
MCSGVAPPPRIENPPMVREKRKTATLRKISALVT